jgi:hypothetical protein
MRLPVHPTAHYANNAQRSSKTCRNTMTCFPFVPLQHRICKGNHEN